MSALRQRWGHDAEHRKRIIAELQAERDAAIVDARALFESIDAYLTEKKRLAHGAGYALAEGTIEMNLKTDDHDHWFIRHGGRCVVCGAPYYKKDRASNADTRIPPTIDELIVLWEKAAQYERICRDNAEFESEKNYRQGRAEIYELLVSELRATKIGLDSKINP